MLVSNYPNVSINTANPPTELARRDAVRRDLFEPVKEAEKSGAEKPLVADDKARSAASAAANLGLYDANGKETETQQAVSGRDERQQGGQQGNDSDAEQSPQQQAKQKQIEQQEQQEIQELKSRDQEVRTHEAAHAAIGGQYAGAPSYTFERGPDGQQYAVGGEVPIDISPIAGDPQATVQKMQQVRAAALAPAEPSSADRRIAADAMQRQLQAQAEIVQQSAATASASGADSAKAGFAVQDAQTDISYSMARSDGDNISIQPQRDTLAMAADIQHRRNVIAGFYQHATTPASRELFQQV